MQNLNHNRPGGTNLFCAAFFYIKNILDKHTYIVYNSIKYSSLTLSMEDVVCIYKNRIFKHRLPWTHKIHGDIFPEEKGAYRVIGHTTYNPEPLCGRQTYV